MPLKYKFRFTRQSEAHTVGTPVVVRGRKLQVITPTVAPWDARQSLAKARWRERRQRIGAV